MATSSYVHPGIDGHLIYEPDGEGDAIIDFSNVGYRAGAEPPVDVPVRAIVSPQSGDDGAAIQQAINTVGVLPLDENGFRGAVLLTQGEYQISGHLSIWASGVVLRGEGDGSKGTTLRATGKDRRALLYAFGTPTREMVAGTEHNVAEKYVPAGARSLRLDSTAGLAVGDSVIVNRPSPANWIQDIGMNRIWSAGGMDLSSDRVITHIAGDVVTLDAPLTTALDQRYGGGTIQKYVWPGRIEDVGVENLRAVSDYTSRSDENHSWSFFDMGNIQNVWVRNVTTQHFAFSAVNVGRLAKWVTVDDVQGLDPIARTTGGRKYTFNVDGQLTLVKNSYSRGARHDFVVGGNSPGPNVFVDSRADGSREDSGPHQRWSSGILLDNIRVPGNQINIRNRGRSAGHGWTAANSVVWNSQARSFIVENPPTAQNWLIGSKGSMLGSKSKRGHVDSPGKPVNPRSLYYTQLNERQAQPHLEIREYRLGDIDGLANDGAIDDLAADSAWLAAVAALAGGAAQGLDSLQPATPVALTIEFDLAYNEQVVAATLHLGVRGTSKNTAADRIYLDDLESPLTAKQLGWGTTSTSKVAGRAIDLTQYLAALQDGTLNIAIFDDLAVDWATLHVHIAPLLVLPPAVAAAPADAAGEADAALELLLAESLATAPPVSEAEPAEVVAAVPAPPPPTEIVPPAPVVSSPAEIVIDDSDDSTDDSTTPSASANEPENDSPLEPISALDRLRQFRQRLRNRR